MTSRAKQGTEEPLDLSKMTVSDAVRSVRAVAGRLTVGSLWLLFCLLITWSNLEGRADRAAQSRQLERLRVTIDSLRIEVRASPDPSPVQAGAPTPDNSTVTPSGAVHP